MTTMVFAVVVDGAIEVGTIMTVTLSADHRVLDGALAAQWLAAFDARLAPGGYALVEPTRSSAATISA
mgnify:CR=1 FL=1